MKNILILIILAAIGYTQTPDSLSIKTPKKAALYGTMFPGGGQVYNGKILKAIMIMSLEIAAIYQWSLNGDIFANYDSGNYNLSRHRYLEKRNKYAWWTVILYVYGILDAMVDAHLSSFNDIMNENIELNESDREE